MEQLLMSRFIICRLQNCCFYRQHCPLFCLAVFLLLFLLLPEHSHLHPHLLLSKAVSFEISSPPLTAILSPFPLLWRPCISLSFLLLPLSLTVLFPFLLSRSKALNFILRLVLCPVEAQAFTVFLDQDEHDCDEPQILVWTLTVHITIYMTL